MTNFLIYEDQRFCIAYQNDASTIFRRATAFTIFYEALLNEFESDEFLLYSSPLCLGSFHATPLSYNLPCCGWFE